MSDSITIRQQAVGVLLLFALLAFSGCGVSLPSKSQMPGMKLARQYNEALTGLIEAFDSVRDASSAAQASQQVTTLYANYSAAHKQLLEYQADHDGQVEGPVEALSKLTNSIAQNEKRVKNQIQRLRTIQSLPTSFTNPLRLGAYKTLETIVDFKLAMGEPIDRSTIRSYEDIVAAYRAGPIDQIVELTFPIDSAEQAQAITSRMFRRQSKVNNAYQITTPDSVVIVMTSTSMEEAIAMVDFGTVTNRYDSFRQIEFAVDPRLLEPGLYVPHPDQKPSPNWSDSTREAWLAAVRKYGSAQVVTIEVVDAEGNRRRLQNPMQTVRDIRLIAFGASTSSFSIDQGWFAPIEDFNRFCDRLSRIALIVDRNPQAHVVRLRFPETEQASSSSRLATRGRLTEPRSASIPTDRSQSTGDAPPEENHTLTHSYVQALDQAVAKYGSRRVLVVKVANHAELSEMEARFSSIGECFKRVIPEPKRSYWSQQDEGGFIAPVEDFDALCRAIDFGEVLSEVDKPILMLKIKMYPSALAYGEEEEEEEEEEFEQAGFSDFPGELVDEHLTALEEMRDRAPPEMRKHLDEAIRLHKEFLNKGRARQARANGKKTGRGDDDEDDYANDFNNWPSKPTKPKQELPDPSDSDYLPKLADLMVNPKGRVLEAAALEELLKIDPKTISDRYTFNRIARNFKKLAFEPGLHQKKAIRGLVHYGGKYSVPPLIELLQDTRQEEVVRVILDGLVKTKEPRGIAEIARQTKVVFNTKLAIKAMRQIGPSGETALLEELETINEIRESHAALEIIALLGEIGGDESKMRLRNATKNYNKEIRSAARDALQEIEQRQ
eukprot:Plantae.Rhodophyta-Hildenbrandia_rubra.ctg9911.p1 GENE.Plantae.Rhodophyta-Hildenbrandia_rubra.ctg9911~~Plantae.Rhodophyta-Hildenbrandia_rubra.ctg9911.p1  ORF type:complete len:834 (-),score=113.93 Plantae.Rhodophyta-Hildenbrandia_rubra.ctg9911:206-2707(-)